MTNKLETYVANIQGIIESTDNVDHINQLSDVQVFLLNLSDLFGRDIQQPTISSGPMQLTLGQGLPVGRVTEMATPTPAQNPILVGGVVPAPAAPGAMRLSSGVTPQVDGCIAAQPNTIVQQAAQQRLDQLLAQEKAERDAKQAEVQAKLDAELNAKKSQDELTASLLQQMIPKTAAVVAPTGETVAVSAAPVEVVGESKGMTLADFVAMQSKVNESLAVVAPPAPSDQMTLEEFVKSQGKVSEAQAQLDAALADQLANKQESIQPGQSLA